MEQSFDAQLAAGAGEGLEYLRNALRGGQYEAELLTTARFLVEVKLAHDHQHDHEEEYTYSTDTDDDEELHGEE
ncbi:MAG TPA: hypothetical protein VHB98_00615 [Chloroflexota bacterium]|nr:hypothetical protein [Chloroflexota bacterium]